MTTKNTTNNTPFTNEEIAKAIAGVNSTMKKMAPLIPGIIADAIAKNTTTTTNAKRQRALDLAKKRIGDCRNITPERLVDADKATKTIASARKHPLVRDISVESDGVWIYLHDGWTCSVQESNAISEDNAKQAIAMLKQAIFDRSTMDDQDDDAPKQASAPEANEEGFGESMTIEQIMAINAKRKQATSAPEAKAERISSLNAMRETIQTKINAIRAQNNGEGWHKHNDEAKAIAWRILIEDVLFVDASIHNANLGFVDVASVRQRVLRSLFGFVDVVSIRQRVLRSL